MDKLFRYVSKEHDYFMYRVADSSVGFLKAFLKVDVTLFQNWVCFGAPPTIDIKIGGTFKIWISSFSKELIASCI